MQFALNEQELEASSDALAGKTFVFTGELQKFGRKEAAEIIEKMGGKEIKSVSKNTNYLVVAIPLARNTKKLSSWEWKY